MADRDPEHVHRVLVAGLAPDRLLAVAAGLEQLAHDVDERAEDLTAAVHRAKWRGGEAAKAFRDAVEETFMATVAASWRLDRGAEAVRRAGRSGVVLEQGANAVLGVWRSSGRSADDRKEALTSLARLTARHDHHLMAAREILKAASEKLEEWMQTGAARDFRLAVRTGAGRGVRIPDSALNGDRGGWTQQGLAHDPVTGQFLVTSYHRELTQVTMVSGTSGAEVSSVGLGTVPGATDGVPGPKHAGGISVVGDDVFVVSTERDGHASLYRYSLTALQMAAQGTTVAAEAKFEIEAGTSSYLAVDGQSVYLGNTKPPTLETAPLAAVTSSSGGPLTTSPLGWDPPPHVNGLVVSPAGFTFAQGSDRDHSTSALYHYGADGTPGPRTPLGNMAEEVELVDGQLVGLSESGSASFGPGKHPDRLWGQTNMYELSAAQVFGTQSAETLEVDAATMRGAAADLMGVHDALRVTRNTLGGVEVQAAWNGGVPHAGLFATTTRAYLDHTDAPLRAAARRAERVAEALDATATRFESADLTAAEGLASLRRRLR